MRYTKSSAITIDRSNSIKSATKRLSSLSGSHWRDLEKVLNEFDSMIRKGESPDAFIYSTMFKACADRNPPAVGTAIGLWEDMTTYGVIPNTVVFNSMINVFASNGSVHEAEKYYRSMEDYDIVPDLQTYNSLIHACAESANIERAMYWFNMLVDKTNYNPDEHTFNTLIASAAKSENAQKGFEFYALMKKHGVKSNIQTITTVLKLCSQANLLDQALELFKSAQKILIPDTVMWNAMLNVCAKTGRFEKGMEIWEEFCSQSNVQPDAASVNAIFDLCGQKGDFNVLCETLAGVELLDIKLNEYSLPTLINGCVKAKNADRAFKWFNLFKDSMPCNKVALCNLFRILSTNKIYADMSQRLFHEALGKGIFSENVMDPKGVLLLAGLPSEVAKIALIYGLDTIKERIEKFWKLTTSLEIITGRGKIKESVKKFLVSKKLIVLDHKKNIGRIIVPMNSLKDVFRNSRRRAKCN